MEEMSILLREKILVALGSPAQNAPKYISSAAVLRLAEDPEAMSQAVGVIHRHWRRRNGTENRTKKGTTGPKKATTSCAQEAVVATPNQRGELPS